MIHRELGIRRAESPAREPSAWLLAGQSSARWLEMIASWELPDDEQEALRLFVLPAGNGVLVAARERATLDVPPSGAAYARLGERLFLPIDAVIEPDLSLEEIETLLGHDVVVFHPSLGPVGFDSEQVLHPSSLLSFPNVAAGRFSKPVVPDGISDRIHSVSLAEPVSFEDFFEQERDGIGSSSPEEIPKTSEEPDDGLIEDLKRRAIEPIARGARALTRRMPGESTSPTWVHRLEHWANEKLRHVSEELERLRHKELHRLLDLLDSDAEKGLQHALPLGGGTHRGLASPGARLTPRPVDFHLGALGGGQPLDPWDVPFELQQKLLAKYRQLANRERKLGRYRRAAYIYAELIGDVETGAAVLKEGKHYREAAEIYRKYLNKPLVAARTYEAGGLFPEAVAIYEELDMWEEAGDVYRKTDQTARARQAYEQARSKFLRARDLLGASRIAETKLEDVADALAIVEEGWPGSRQASDCLDRQLDIHAREGLHEKTEVLLERLEGEATPPQLVTRLVSSLATAASSYPNARLRNHAADLARRKIASRLEVGSRDEARELLESLYRLAPEDRLLARDGGRFLVTKEHHRPPPRPSRGASAEPELTRSCELPDSVRWLELRSMGSLFFALGHSRTELQLYRGNWSGAHEALSWPLGRVGQELAAEAKLQVMMELDATGHRNVVLRFGAGMALALRTFAPSREVIEAETTAGDPGWLPRGTLALANASQSWVALRYHRERLILSTYNAEGAHLAEIADWERPDGLSHLVLACQNQFIIVGQSYGHLSGEFLVFDVGQMGALDERPAPFEPKRFFTPSAITDFRVAHPYTRSRVVVTMMEGVLLHWLDTLESYRVATDLEWPRACLLRNGALVVVTAKAIRVYRADRGEPSLTSATSFPAPHAPVVGVVPGYAPNQFAVLTGDGRLRLFALTAG